MKNYGESNSSNVIVKCEIKQSVGEQLIQGSAAAAPGDGPI